MTPYAPACPPSFRGEVLTQEVVDYLLTGIAAGMLVPDTADPSLGTLRVVAR